MEVPMYRNNNTKRFWSKVEMGKPDECWEWRAYRNQDGYGKYMLNGRVESAHRIAWQMNWGDIPDGLCVCHRCDNPACINPAHLYLATHQENMDDMREKGRAKGHPGEENYKAKLTTEQVKEIRRSYKGGYGEAIKTAKKYGVSTSTIQRIASGVLWKTI